MLVVIFVVWRRRGSDWARRAITGVHRWAAASWAPTPQPPSAWVLRFWATVGVKGVVEVVSVAVTIGAGGACAVVTAEPLDESGICRGFLAVPGARQKRLSLVGSKISSTLTHAATDAQCERQSWISFVRPTANTQSLMDFMVNPARGISSPL